MPITFSHPVAVLPFIRTRLVFSALVVGSMSPDFLYFVKFAPGEEYGHTLAGLFLFSLPAGLFALWLYHNILKVPLFYMLPVSHQKKLYLYTGAFKFAGIRNFVLISFSILIGALTHIAWDSFTHEHGWSVQRFTILSTPVISTSFGDLRIYKILQYAGHLLGLPVLMYSYYRWLKSAAEQPVQAISSPSAFKTLLNISILLTANILIAGIITFYKAYPFTSLESYYRSFGVFVILSINFIFISTVIYCLYWKYKNKNLFSRNAGDNLV